MTGNNVFTLFMYMTTPVVHCRAWKKKKKMEKFFSNNCIPNISALDHSQKAERLFFLYFWFRLETVLMPEGRSETCFRRALILFEKAPLWGQNDQSKSYLWMSSPCWLGINMWNLRRRRISDHRRQYHVTVNIQTQELTWKSTTMR